MRFFTNWIGTPYHLLYDETKFNWKDIFEQTKDIDYYSDTNLFSFKNKSKYLQGPVGYYSVDHIPDFINTDCVVIPFAHKYKNLCYIETEANLFKFQKESLDMQYPAFKRIDRALIKKFPADFL